MRAYCNFSIPLEIFIPFGVLKEEYEHNFYLFKGQLSVKLVTRNAMQLLNM